MNNPIRFRILKHALIDVSAVPAVLLLILSFSGCNRSADLVSIGDRFAVCDEVITDLLTGMQWQLGPDYDIDWEDARDWITSLQGDWVMPSCAHLNQLWNAGVSIFTWGPFVNSGNYVWCLYSDGDSDKSHRFSFIPVDPFGMGNSNRHMRVFAVRDSRGSWTIAREQSSTGLNGLD